MGIKKITRPTPTSRKKQIGAAAIEYAVVAGLVALLLVSIFGSDGAMNDALTAAFEKVTEAITPTTSET
ncbi:MAG: Flp family type IVb pilin [Gammaproteobacteria bacterium]